MNDASDFQEFKNKKRAKQILSDIAAIDHIFDLTQRSLGFYKKYKTVQEVVSILETQRTLLEIHRKKYEKELKELK